jgi:hypothetical protein
MKSSRRKKLANPEAFSLDTDYTSVHGYSDQPAPEPSTSKKRKRKRVSALHLFAGMVVLRLVAFWRQLTSLRLALQHQSMSTMQEPQMLADFVIRASMKDSMALENSSNYMTKPSSASQDTQRQLRNVTTITSVQQGAPEAKFIPESPSQQISKLLRITMHNQHQGIPTPLAAGQSDVIDFKLNDYIVTSDSLHQCSTILTNPNSMKELMYWEHHPEDFSQLSQWYNADSRFLTFEPDTGGFASQRMVLEQVIVLAYALGRTLVLPPRQGMRDGSLLSYEDFFGLRTSLGHHYKGIRIVTTDEFLQFVALPGYLRDPQGDTSTTSLGDARIGIPPSTLACCISICEL